MPMHTHARTHTHAHTRYASKKGTGKQAFYEEYTLTQLHCTTLHILALNLQTSRGVQLHVQATLFCEQAALEAASTEWN